MDVTARLGPDADAAMLLFQVRRLKGQAEVWTPPQGGPNVYVRGTLPDDALEGFLAALNGRVGAVHADDRHVALTKSGPTECATVQAAEAHLGGPWTDELVLSGALSMGNPVLETVLQTLYHGEDELPLKAFTDQGLRADQAMDALQNLRNQGKARMYRREQDGQPVTLYGLAREERDRLSGHLRG